MEENRLREIRDVNELVNLYKTDSQSYAIYTMDMILAYACDLII